MKLNLELLKKFIELPVLEAQSLRALFDDLGLEVDGVELENGQTILNIETLAQRGDHLSALGVARELSARLLTNVKYPKFAELPNNTPAKASLKVEAAGCYNYALLDLQLSDLFPLDREVSRFLANVPEDRPALVSYLNYVQMELGQPMHAFDYDKIEGEIKVVLSDVEQECLALDGKTYRVPVGSLLIVDRKKTIAVAGVIGCANSMVDQNTKRVLIESATFDPILVRKTARKMGISTDASYVFERGADPDNAIVGLRRLLALLESASSVNAAWVHALGLTQITNHKLAAKEVEVDLNYLRQQLALPKIKAIEVTSRLKHLGYVVAEGKSEEIIKIKVPSWRLWNCEDHITVIEDFVRSYGLNSISLQLPAATVAIPKLNSMQHFLAQVEPVLTGMGFSEVVTRSYYSNAQVEWLEQLQPGISDRHVKIANALDSAYSHLRLTNLIHLAQLAERSHRQGLASVKVYEINRVFSKARPEASPYDHEQTVLALTISGRWYDNLWQREPEVSELLSHLHGTLASIFEVQGKSFEVRNSCNALLHPSCQAEILCEGRVVGNFGLIHPLLKDRLELSHELIYAELAVDLLNSCATVPKKLELNNLPSMRRDLTLKLPQRQFAGQLVSQIQSLKLPHLQKIDIANDFQKPGESFRRTTFKLMFQAEDRTLQAAEVDVLVQELIATLAKQFEIELAA